MNDDEATTAIENAVALAVTLRDEGEHAVRAAARELLTSCGGDPIAAVCVIAALINLDAPLAAWWQQVEPAPVCGTEQAYSRHLYLREQPDLLCRRANARRVAEQRKEAV